MEEKEQILIENIKEYLELGNTALKIKKYNSATTLYFKAIAAMCDLFILRKEKFIPSTHTNRFRILEQKYPEHYELIDKIFPFYQQSYTAKMDEETALLLKENAEQLKKNLGI